MWKAPHARAASPSSTRAARQSTSRAVSAPYAVARPGTDAMSGSSYWPMSAVYVHGTAPFSRIHATATDVSRPPEKAMPTRSPTGREASTLVMDEIICTSLHDHATRSARPPVTAYRFLLLSTPPSCRYSRGGHRPASVLALGATGPRTRGARRAARSGERGAANAATGHTHVALGERRPRNT